MRPKVLAREEGGLRTAESLSSGSSIRSYCSNSVLAPMSAVPGRRAPVLR
jgi:hypothetical protein